MYKRLQAITNVNPSVLFDSSQSVIMHFKEKIDLKKIIKANMKKKKRKFLQMCRKLL